MENIVLGFPFVVSNIISIYKTLIIIYALLSWFPGAYQSKLGIIISKLVQPFLSVIERVIPPIMGISFSPIIAFFILDFIGRLLLRY